mmetsp:Transcript_32977/g.49818  ORF Transcript_32977/g.49818 Transcript_32977/m.49818 type:complete len:217 (-) Transcript_32977:110-760(-)
MKLRKLRQKGSVTCHDFVSFVMNEKLGLTKAQAKSMFEYADKDSNGSLTKQELKAVIEPAEHSAMSTPLRIIVPSTEDVSGSISIKDMKQRCDQVVAFLAETFGGATASAPQRGAYRSDSGRIVFEEVVSVTSFCTPDSWKEHVADVRTYVRQLCRDWSQECIGLEFAGLLEYISSTDPTPQQLWASVVPRYHKRQQLLESSSNRISDENQFVFSC